jgi:hypothetical protein
VGDINYDGYNGKLNSNYFSIIKKINFSDIAIGAPYEDNGGAIYIYSGGKTGIITPYIQVLQLS